MRTHTYIPKTEAFSFKHYNNHHHRRLFIQYMRVYLNFIGDVHFQNKNQYTLSIRGVTIVVICERITFYASI